VDDPVAVEVAVPVAVAVAGPVTRARVKRHLSLQNTQPSEWTGSGNSSGCLRCSSPNATSSMSDYVAARLKQIREATAMSEEKKRLEDVKRKQCSLAQIIPHDQIVRKYTSSYSSCR
jgi:hypothetical protein